MSEEIMVFCCPPDCEHVWDGPEKIFFRECAECEGGGIIYSVVGGEPDERLCEKCDGKGELECGASVTCSKCGMDKMNYDMWNGP